MDAALLGAISALSFGSADFIARFTSQRLGPAPSLLAVLAIGLVPILIYFAVLGAPLRRLDDAASTSLVMIYGFTTAFAMLLLYEGLARGPVTVVAPMVGRLPRPRRGACSPDGPQPRGTAVCRHADGPRGHVDHGPLRRGP
jgi:uncharacterized membrane protein